MGDLMKKRQVRRRDHIAKDLRTPKYRQRVVPAKTREDEDDRTWRLKGLNDYLGYEPYDD